MVTPWLQNTFSGKTITWQPSLDVFQKELRLGFLKLLDLLYWLSLIRSELLLLLICCYLDTVVKSLLLLLVSRAGVIQKSDFLICRLCCSRKFKVELLPASLRFILHQSFILFWKQHYPQSALEHWQVRPMHEANWTSHLRQQIGQGYSSQFTCLPPLRLIPLTGFGKEETTKGEEIVQGRWGLS